MLGLHSRFKLFPPHELPQRWIELSQFDIAVISFNDLKSMATSQPKQFAAVRDWLSTGPALMVYGVGEKYASLQELESLLELLPLRPHSSAPAFRGWRIPDPGAKNANVTQVFDQTAEAASVPAVGDAGDTALPPSSPVADDENAQIDAQMKSAATTPQPFLFRPAVMGCLVAIASDNPFPGSRKGWDEIFGSVGLSHWQWFKRTGFSLNRTNKDYWQFLIPGVGQAPVYSFLLLVSLFAVAIGPVNFYVLGRARRLYFLLLTVPIGAVLVTLSLFAFAVVSDGLGTRLRVRSYAELDQATGRAAVWSRQSYYAGIAPSRGLKFPDDTTVFPVTHEPGSSTNDKSTLLVWDGDQHLRGGYLASRTATQFVACRATTTAAKIVVQESTSAQATLPIENLLGANINFLVVCDSRGDYFSGTSIRDKSKAELKKTDPATAQKTMNDMATDDAVRPAQPEGFNDRSWNDNLLSIFGVRRYRYGTSDSGAGEPVMSDSLLETHLSAATSTSARLPSCSFVVILERSPLVSTGVGPINEEASFHVIRGRY
jgi:hypothetical protein